MTARADRRGAARIDKIFRVRISSDQWGEQWFIARNISTTGMFVEMAELLPLKTKVVVRFAPPSDLDDPESPELCALARVQNHYYLQYCDRLGMRALRGVGLRFLRFAPEAGASVPAEQLH